MTEEGTEDGFLMVARYSLTTLYIGVLIVTITLNGLAGPGTGPFSSSTEDLSEKHKLCFTPADYTFAIWGVIYFILIIFAVYAVALLFRKVNFVPSYKLGGAVTIPFLGIFIINLCFNIGWLFAWNNVQLIGSAVILIIIVVTNTLALSFGLYSFMKTSTDMIRISKFDFWMSIIVLNGQSMYTFWTVVASLLNLGIAVAYTKDSSPSAGKLDNICIVILSFLLSSTIIYFIVEQTVLKELTNHLFSHYLVYIWAMIGCYVQNKDCSNSRVINLIITNISFAILLLLLRLLFLVYKNFSHRIDLRKL